MTKVAFGLRWRLDRDVQAIVAERPREETLVTRDENLFDEGGSEAWFELWVIPG